MIEILSFKDQQSSRRIDLMNVQTLMTLEDRDLFHSFMEGQRIESLSWLELAAYQDILPHKHPYKSIMIFTAGSGICKARDESNPMQTFPFVAPCALLIFPHIMHAFVAHQDTSFLALRLNASSTFVQMEEKK